LALWAASALASDPAARRTLTPDDLYRVLDVSDPQVSPEGLMVIKDLAERMSAWLDRFIPAQ
jgi:hypothetical protein